MNKRQKVLLLWAAGVVPVQKCSFWLLLLTTRHCDILLAKVRVLLWSPRLLNQLQTKFTHRSVESSDHPFQKKPLHDTPLLSPCHAKFRPNMYLFPGRACFTKQDTNEFPQRNVTCKLIHGGHVITARCVIGALPDS